MARPNGWGVNNDTSCSGPIRYCSRFVGGVIEQPKPLGTNSRVIRSKTFIVIYDQMKDDEKSKVGY